MPKVFEWHGCRFFFYANEGTPLEPCHIHVRKGTYEAKFWIDPEVVLVSSYGFSSQELHELQEVIHDQQQIIRRTWNDFFQHRSESVNRLV